MKYLTFFLLLVSLHSCVSGQSLMDCRETVEMQEIVSNLENSEYSISYNYMPEISIIGSNARFLLRKGKDSGCSLYNNIVKGEKVEISHILLSLIFEEPDYLMFEIKYEWDQDSVKSELFSYNQLEWSPKGIDEGSLKAIRDYWERRLN